MLDKNPPAFPSFPYTDKITLGRSLAGRDDLSSPATASMQPVENDSRATTAPTRWRVADWGR
jgi:hypothetical protein